MLVYLEIIANFCWIVFQFYETNRVWRVKDNKITRHGLCLETCHMGWLHETGMNLDWDKLTLVPIRIPVSDYMKPEQMGSTPFSRWTKTKPGLVQLRIGTIINCKNFQTSLSFCVHAALSQWSGMRRCLIRACTTYMSNDWFWASYTLHTNLFLSLATFMLFWVHRGLMSSPS